MFLSPHLLRLASDARLVALVRERHPAAFEAVYNRHHRAILSFCRHMLGDPQEAEDAVQQTFLAAYSDLIASEKPIHLRAWLFTIARNRCYSLLRRRREQPTSELDEAVTEGLASQVQRRQDLRDLVVDLRRLPDDQRAALVLAELDALSHEEIASALGVPREKVKALVFQARESLVSSRTARETDCAEIRQQLSTQRGGALRRANLRSHLRECAGCRDFRREIERQRRQLAVLLPVAPTVALKEGVLGATIGAGTVAGAGTGGLMISTALKSGLAKGALGALLAGAGAATTIVATHGLQRPTSHAARHRVVTSSATSPSRPRVVNTTAAHRVVPAPGRVWMPRRGVNATAAIGVIGPHRGGAAGVPGSRAGSFIRWGAANPFAAVLGAPKALRGGRVPARRAQPSAPAVVLPPQPPATPIVIPVIFPQAPLTIPASMPITSSGGAIGQSPATNPGAGHRRVAISGSGAPPAATNPTGSPPVPQRGSGDDGSDLPLQMHRAPSTGATGVTPAEAPASTSLTAGTSAPGSTGHVSPPSSSSSLGPHDGFGSGSGWTRPGPPSLPSPGAPRVGSRTSPGPDGARTAYSAPKLAPGAGPSVRTTFVSR